MTEQPLENFFTKVINILIFIFPIVIISLQVAGDIVLFIIAMMGIYVAISKKLSPFAIKDLKVFSYLTMGYFFAVCLSVLFSGQASEIAHYIPRDFYFLFAPFIALALFTSEVNIKYLIVGIKVSLLILGMIVSYHLLSGVSRPTGVINPGVFGNLSVSLFFILICFFQHETLKHKIFSFISLLSGLFIIIASGTRGAWLSFLLLSAVYLYFFFKQKNNFRTKTKIITLIVLPILILFGSINQNIYDRTNSAYEETSEWFSGNYAHTSVGQRLIMYSEAIKNIEDGPFFGHGYRTSNLVLFQNEDDKEYSKFTKQVLAQYNHLHNAYLTQYYNGGIVLLGALLLVLIVPLIIFIKANSKDCENPIFISGALLTLGYASFGMVNILLGDTYMNGFYVFFLAILMLLANKSMKTLDA